MARIETQTVTLRIKGILKGDFVAFTVQAIADWVGGIIEGDASRSVVAAKPLNENPNENEITVILSEKNLAQLENTAAGVVMAPKSLVLNPEILQKKTLIRVDDALMAFVTIVQKMHVKPVQKMTGIHPSAIIHPTARLGKNVAIGPFVSIGEGCEIGDDATLMHGVYLGAHCQLGNQVWLGPNVSVYDGSILGHRVIIHGNSVIGADGFGYRNLKGMHTKIPQVGNVVIGDDVEIGACVTVDRATFGSTRIGRGTKIDNHCQIAHNCQLGEHNIFAGHVGLAGSVTTGDYVVLAGQVGVADHSKIGARTMIGAKSGVHSEVPPDQVLLGSPPRPVREELQILATLEKLPKMRAQLRKILKKLGLEEE
ncbi:MAG: UDP-3-O-(3-hydroxymyristoyl)glucosamine N-acyltransferase [Gemmataceae bacterium]|nr:UDP-3-O-(3-hydroxymyristoyl)glucosamine N-acyltransferase [Gemmataceae bacterium]